jgi:hypothetical protein
LASYIIPKKCIKSYVINARLDFCICYWNKTTVASGGNL